MTQTKIEAKMLSHIFKEEGIKWSTGMWNKDQYVCIFFADGKPRLNKKTGKMVQKYRKRYLPKDISSLIISAQNIK